MRISKRAFITIGEKDRNTSGFVGGRERSTKPASFKYRNIFNAKPLIKKGGLLSIA
jgi:hypothetical protein